MHDLVALCYEHKRTVSLAEFVAWARFNNFSDLSYKVP